MIRRKIWIIITNDKEEKKVEDSKKLHFTTCLII